MMSTLRYLSPQLQPATAYPARDSDDVRQDAAQEADSPSKRIKHVPAKASMLSGLIACLPLTVVLPPHAQQRAHMYINRLDVTSASAHALHAVRLPVGSHTNALLLL